MEKTDSIFCGCLYYSSNALARVMTKMADEEFAVTGLTASYAFLLLIVNGNPGIQPKDISTYMLLTPSTITRLIEKMEQKKLVERKSTGRIIEVFSTEKGQGLDKSIKESWQGLYNRYSALIGEDQAIKLTSEIYAAVKQLE